MMISNLLCRFHDKLQPDAHDLFQAWRTDYVDGYFLNLRTASSALLHQEGRCMHHGNKHVLRDDWEGSLTLNEKVCSPHVSVLLMYAKLNGIRVRPCRHCNTSTELGATFVAYQKNERGPFPSTDEEEIGFESGKGFGELSKAFGALTWVISGEKEGSRQHYYLRGYYVPNRVETEDGSAYLIGQGTNFDEPLELTSEAWLLELLRDQMNFHRGTGTALSEPVALNILRFVLGKPDDSVEPPEAEGGQVEGRVIEGWTTRYERGANREACLQAHGTACAACALNMEAEYGSLGRDAIEVHHLTPLSVVKGEHRPDPVRDMRPLCPNCHTIVHRAKPMLTIEELRLLLGRSRRLLLLR